MSLPDIEDEPLCCCEFINNNGQKSHLLALFCDCEELDTVVDRLFKGEAVDGDHTHRLTEDILDRLRIPTIYGGGARRIDDLFDTTVLPPIVIVPLSIYISALHPLASFTSLILVPFCVFFYYRKVLRYKRRTQFFMSWALMSFFTMYAAMFFILVSDYLISSEEFAALTLFFSAFLLAFFFTKLGPGYIGSHNELSRKGPKRTERDHQEIIQNSKKRISTSYESGLTKDDLQHSVLDSSISLNVQTKSSSNWCSICNLEKPPRAGHCRICGTCVYRLDHHCVWVDCCIGRDNHLSFILCLILFVIGSWWGSFRSIIILFSSQYGIVSKNFDVFERRSTAVVFVGALYVLGSSLTVLSLLLHQLWLISHNWTYRERKVLARDPKQAAVLSSRNRGFLQNWKEFLFGERE